MSDVTEKVASQSADLKRIMELLPHRPPMLLVDRIEDMVLGERAVGFKTISGDEWFFKGHFPGAPIMPGVMIVEALAQTAGAVVVATLGKGAEGKLVYFMAIDKARFRKPVLPGCELHLHVKALKGRGTIWRFAGEARVNGELCCDAEFMAMIRDQSAPAA